MTPVKDNAASLGDISSLAAFEPDLAGQDRADIQDMLLDAQLFASHVYDFQRHWTSWMHYYRNRLSARGLRQKSLVLDDSLVISSTEDLMNATFRIVGTVAHERLAELVRRSFHAMGIYQAANTYFDHGFDNGRLGSFQIVPCARVETGQCLVLLCGLHVSVDEYSGGGRRLLFYFKGGAYVFESGAYARHRADVARYLRGKAGASIASLNI